MQKISCKRNLGKYSSQFCYTTYSYVAHIYEPTIHVHMQQYICGRKGIDYTANYITADRLLIVDILGDITQLHTAVAVPLLAQQSPLEHEVCSSGHMTHLQVPPQSQERK